MVSLSLRGLLYKLYFSDRNRSWDPVAVLQTVAIALQANDRVMRKANVLWMLISDTLATNDLQILLRTPLILRLGSSEIQL